MWRPAIGEQAGFALAALPLTDKGVSSLDDRDLLLLVEDEALIRMVLEDTLSDAGFKVVAASNGSKAVEELATNPARFRAVVTDIRLGRGPDGWDVARRAREVEPTMPVLYVSGDSAHEWSARGVPNSAMVAKPFVGAQIVTALATLLVQVDSR